MALCLNGYPMEEGAITRRPGTQFAYSTQSGLPARVIPFYFDEDLPYTMEFTNFVMRLRQGVNLVTLAPQALSNITPGNPAVFTTAQPHGFANGLQIVFGASSQPRLALPISTLLGRQFIVTVVNSTQFTMVDALLPSVPITAAGMNFVAGQTVAVILQWATDYTTELLDGIRVIPNNEQAVILCPGQPPQIFKVTAEPTASYPFHTFQLYTPLFEDGPYLDPITSTTITLSAATSPVSVTVADPTQINNGQGFLATDVGRAIRILIEPAPFNFATAYTAGQGVCYPEQAAFTGGATTYYVASANTTGQYPTTNSQVWTLDSTQSGWIWGIIQSVSGPNSVAVVTLGEGGHTAASYYNVQQSTFQMGAFYTGVYPTCGTYHEGRLMLGGAYPNRFDLSMSNNITWWSPSDLQSGQVNDNHAINYTLDSSDSNEIVWMMPDANGVVMGTKAGEWLLQASTLAEPITPTNIQAHRVTRYGCYDMEPLRTGISLVFIQKYQRRVLELLSDVFTGKFTAPNLSTAATDLMASGIEEICYNEELEPIIWARTGAGQLIGCTYRRVSNFTTEAPIFTGWHQHQLGSGRIVESICAGPSPNGLLDALTMVTRDISTNVRYVEVMAKMVEAEDPTTSAWLLDCAAVPPILSVDETAGVTVWGLNHLEGRTVSAWIAGLDCGDYLVTNGSFVVPYSSDPDGMFNWAYLQQMSYTSPSGQAAVTDIAQNFNISAVVGFTYQTQWQLLRLLTPQASGSRAGPSLGDVRRIDQFSVLLHNCHNGTMSFGTDFSNMHPLNYTSPNGTIYQVATSINGVYVDTIENDYSFDGQLACVITRPYPATIVAWGGWVETQDR